MSMPSTARARRDFEQREKECKKKAKPVVAMMKGWLVIFPVFSRWPQYLWLNAKKVITERAMTEVALAPSSG
jgi:hypothetical protein